MTQSTLQSTVTPLHLAVVMDGNGRWATARGLPRSAGHREGARAARAIVEAAAEQGVTVLTLYAFSADNWGRPRPEVSSLLRLLRGYLAAEAQRCARSGVRIVVIGRRDRLPPRLLEAIRAAESRTATGDRLLLRVAIDYSAREAICRAVEAEVDAAVDSRVAQVPAAGGPAAADAAPEAEARAVSPEAMRRRILAAIHDPGGTPDVDLLVRTGGEQRLSDFLLWECACAELYFTPCMWPDFGPAALAEALAEFRRRERRFGRLPAGTAAGGADRAPAWTARTRAPATTGAPGGGRAEAPVAAAPRHIPSEAA